VDTTDWTLDELARRAGEALAADAVRAPNGRVRERPDGRAIRWYATIGLVDRPFTGQGRSARYGPRHLLQLVAVKRLQALGRSLAEIQAELAGATDATLSRIAELPEEVLARPAADQGASSVGNAPADQPAEVSAAESAMRFWTARPAPAPASTPALAPRRARAANPESTLDDEPPAVRYQIALSDTVTLTVPVLPSAADLAALREAAAPLLDLLADRGLITLQGARDEHHAH
jgi:DNA-binding transcriptional MerR regulator